MSTDHHTPIATGAAANAATFNAPLGQLDAAISTGAGLATTGATTGATSQAQPFTVGVTLADTTTATSGIIFKAADRFIHNFHHPTGNTAVPEGFNTFVGVNAGNFAMGSTASSTSHGSYNTAVGSMALTSNMTGYSNTALGFNALGYNTTGYNNTAIGMNAFFANTTGAYNTAVGHTALDACTEGSGNTAVGSAALSASTTANHNTAVGYYALNLTTGANNTAVGGLALADNTTGYINVAVGNSALGHNTTGYWNVAVGNGTLGNNLTGTKNTGIGPLALFYNTGTGNVALGFQAGAYQADGSTELASPENSIYIGADAYGYNDSDSNSIVIGYQAIGLGANTTVIGNTSTTLTALPAGALRLSEMTAPSGAANKATIYAVDNGAGKTKLMVIFGSGVAQQIAIEP